MFDHMRSLRRAPLRGPRRAAAGLVAVVVAGAAAYGGWVASGAGTGWQDARGVPAVETAFSRAVQADQSFGSPSAAYQASVLAAIHAHRQAFIVPAAEESQLLASGTAAITRYFSSAQAPLEQAHLIDMLSADSDPNSINLGSGVSRVTFLHVTVVGSQATVEADVTAWAKSEARQISTGPWLLTDPINVVDDKATLALSPSGGWQVTSLIGDFVPGYGP